MTASEFSYYNDQGTKDNPAPFSSKIDLERIAKDTQTISKDFSTYTGCNCLEENCLGIKI